MYFLIGLSFVLIGIVGLQFTYLFYIDRVLRERKNYLQTLERRHTMLRERLDAAERRVAEQDELIETFFPKLGMSDEAWADVIEER
ncbi:MAG: hypothetical protein AB7J13_02885 [Pyrinomonadaceae bacterium]